MKGGSRMTRKLFDNVIPRTDASGHVTVSVKWVDINKGTEENSKNSLQIRGAREC